MKNISVENINNILIGLLKKKKFNSIRRMMLLLNNEHTENGSLKMILILTKHFKEHPLLKMERENILKRLENNRGEKLI